LDKYRVVSAGKDGKLVINPSTAPFRATATFIQAEPFTALAVYQFAEPTIATGDSAGNVVLWSAEGKATRTMPTTRKLKGGITQLAWDKTKLNLAIGASDGAAAIWYTNG
jgi:hypothetical protein